MKKVLLDYTVLGLFDQTTFWRMNVKNYDNPIYEEVSEREEYHSREYPRKQMKEMDGLALVMDYLHKNPNEKIKVTRRSFLRKELTSMVAIHNHNISLRLKGEQPKEVAPLFTE